MFGPCSLINTFGGKEEFDVKHSQRNMFEVAVTVTVVQNLYEGI